jgi:hypothetical protein
MSRTLVSLSALASLGLAVSSSLAQPPDNRQGRGGERGPPPFMMALDVNSDGVLDQDEIEMAADSLKTLDKNKDGKLSMEELMPPRSPGGFGGPGSPGQGAPGQGTRPSFAQMLEQFDADKDGALSKSEVPEERQRIFEFADRNKDGKIDKEEMESMGRGREGGGDMIAQFDKNGDGKVSKDEAPEFMQRFFDRIDSDGDGFVSKAEADAMRDRARGGPGGGNPGGGSGGERGRRPPAE